MKPMVALALFVVIAGSEAAAEDARAARPPLRDGKTTGLASDPGPAAAEEEALQRLVHRYEKQIRELHQSARGAKGMELAELNRRIEALKTRQFTEELQLRLDIAIDTNDERRRLEMKRVIEEIDSPKKPVAAPGEVRRVERPTGGER